MANTHLSLIERITDGISLGESHFREFKTALERKADGKVEPRAAKEICRNIAEVLVAFANADGGELYIGVEDDGSVTGIPHKSNLIEMMKSAHIHYVHPETPLPSPAVQEVVIEGFKVILYFQIFNSSDRVHLTSDGRCLKRFDRENRPVSAERIQYERQEIASREYDRVFVPNCTVQDLDLDLLDDIATKRLSLGHSPEKLLQFLDLAEFGSNGLRLRRAALLLFATEIINWHPRCEVRIVRIGGTELKTGHNYNVVEDDTVRGNVMTILEKAWDRLRPHLARTRFQANALFRESIIYPEVACREALINAVAHRDYSIEGKPIEVLVFDDRMEVRSPGGLLSSISVAGLKELRGIHQSRNVFVARVLRELGYMQEMGEGIRRIFASVRDFELVDPGISSESNLFTVTLFHKSIFSPKDVQWLEGFTEFDLTKDEQRVALLGREGRLLSTNEIIEILGIVDTDDFRILYEHLSNKGVLFTARQVNTGRRRNIPRFQVRPPYEAQQYLAELQQAFIALGSVEHFKLDINKQLRDRISEGSPYRQNPMRALQALGYLSASRTPLPKARALWTKRHETNRLNAEIAAPTTATSSPPAVDVEPGWLVGRIVTKFDIKGYAFARSDNEDYFLHASEFLEDAWRRVSVGSQVRFRLGESKMTGKSQPGYQVSLI